MSNEVSILKEGLFATEDGKDVLLLGHCKVCGTSFFPERPFCSRCGSDQIEQTSAGEGKLYSWTTVIHPSQENRLELPYGMAKVDFPDHKIRITGVSTETDSEKLTRGQDMRVVIAKAYEDDDGKDVVTYMFQPVEEGK
ncbi:MAG: zinc ribbon domain-containing protein [Clostridiales Family XIII bacterium]|jgi:uncharacterized OB-fold protein|nr:zinc ribbon domain-containing protein [Clostridiales Family XIII bacterium]